MIWWYDDGKAANILSPVTKINQDNLHSVIQFSMHGSANSCWTRKILQFYDAWSRSLTGFTWVVTVHMQNNVKRLGHTLSTVRVKDIRTQLPKPQLDTISCHDGRLMCNSMLSWLQSLLYSPLCIHKKISFGRSMILVKELFNYFTQVCLYSMMIKFCYLRCSAFFRTDNFAATQG